jgi:hypothetical protein
VLQSHMTVLVPTSVGCQPLSSPIVLLAMVCCLLLSFDQRETLSHAVCFEIILVRLLVWQSPLTVLLPTSVGGGRCPHPSFQCFLSTPAVVHGFQTCARVIYVLSLPSSGMHFAPFTAATTDGFCLQFPCLRATGLCWRQCY